MSKRYLISGTLAAAATVALTACSTTSTGTPRNQNAGAMGMSSAPAAANSMTGSASTGATTGAHNGADVAFATDMIPHHRQAVQMADIALNQATNAQVKTLAATIKSDQKPEIVMMSGWLSNWGTSAGSSPPASMGAMGSTGSMGGITMGSAASSMGSMGAMGAESSGMMSDADMTSLGKATGAAFDLMWVQMMITHHKGALAMAKTELATGQSTDAKSLARSITSSQTAQITQLQTLLTQLPH